MNTLFTLLTILTASSAFAADAKPAPTPSHTIHIDDVEFDIVMQAPHLMVAPLQVFGAFEYEAKNDGFSGADLEMDEGFNGMVQDLRKNHQFGHLAEHILLTPPTGGMVVPKQVLIMGLGNPKTWTSKDMEQVGVADIREVCALGLTEFSHASDVQDGGVNRENAGAVAEHVIVGMVNEIRLQKTLATKNAVTPCAIKKITYLAGPKYLKDTITSFDQLEKRFKASSK